MWDKYVLYGKLDKVLRPFRGGDSGEGDMQAARGWVGVLLSR
jgi:hypothetical protein